VLVVVVELETSWLVCADVRAASISGAMASIKVTILKGAVCSLLGRRDFMARPRRLLTSVESGGVAREEALGCGLARE
jgi:hypothetical protein